MRVLIAARLSQLADGQTGLETQDEDARDWAEDNGHEVVATVADTRSGTTPMWERKNLRPWVTQPDLMATYDAIVAAKQDRLSRGKWRDEAAIRTWAEDNRKTLFIVDRDMQWPPAREDDTDAWNSGASQARREWLATSRRYRRMQRKLRESGYLTGRPPFGYRTACECCGAASCTCGLAKCPHHKTLMPTDEGRRYIPQIYQRCIDGESLASIAKWLDDEGARPASGRKWWPKSLADVIRCATYAGRREQWETRADGTKTLHVCKCEPLVDSVTFRRANEALDSRPKRGPVKKENRALLAGIVICPACSWPVTSRQPESPMYQIKAGNGNTHLYYRCAGKGPQRRGCSNMVQSAAVDDLVSRFMLNFDAPIMEERFVPGHDHAVELQDIRVEMRELASRDLPDDEYDRELAKLRSERDRLASLPKTDDRIEYIDTGRTHAEEWESLDQAGRGAWLRSKGIKVYPAKSRELVETVFPGPMARYMAGAHGVDYGTGVSAVITIAGSGLYAAAEYED